MELEPAGPIFSYTTRTTSNVDIYCIDLIDTDLQTNFQKSSSGTCLLTTEVFVVTIGHDSF